MSTIPNAQGVKIISIREAEKKCLVVGPLREGEDGGKYSYITTFLYVYIYVYLFLNIYFGRNLITFIRKKIIL